jgi:hypothetical protein
VRPVRRDQLDALLLQLRVERVGVVGACQQLAGV